MGRQILLSLVGVYDVFATTDYDLLEILVQISRSFHLVANYRMGRRLNRAAAGMRTKPTLFIREKFIFILPVE